MGTFILTVILTLMSVDNFCLCEDYQALVTRIEKLETEQNEQLDQSSFSPFLPQSYDR